MIIWEKIYHLTGNFAINLTATPPLIFNSIEFLEGTASKDADAKKIIAAVDSAMAKTKISLTNIRIDRIDDKIRKSYSSADLHVNETSMPIKYTAQRNAEDKVYVEVTGLDF